MEPTYRSVVRSFEKGEIDFEGLCQAVRDLPYPDLAKDRRKMSWDEIYQDAEEGYSDNSANWFASLYVRQKISEEQLLELVALAQL